MEKSKKPALRFEGFDGDWTQRLVGDLLEERNTQSPKSDEYPLMAFVADKGVTPKGERYDRESLVNDAENKKYKRTEFGDFIYSSNNLETGSIGLNRFGNASISPVYSIFQPTKRGVSDFLGSLFIRKPFIDQMVRWRQGVVYGQWRIHEADFLNIRVNAPEPSEQTKIGELFKHLDGLIAHHQSKYDKLVTVKKAMLQKMFPQKGQLVPEIRFKGFSGEWKYSVVTEIGKTFIGLVTTMTKSYRNEGTLLIRNSDIKNNYFEFSENPIFLEKQFAEDNSTRMLKIGDVVTVHTGDVGTSAVIGKSEEGAIGFATINTRPNPKIIDSHFLSVFLNSDNHKSFAVKMSTGDGRANYNLKDFFELTIPYPELEEQRKIGKYFKNLDVLTNLHKQQLEKLQHIKKACLEKMFV